ncbi:hypothetical protein [Ohtaekwangia sp.]|uniref:hypothetical protein n=1 Tax=Ohtaekwangia sp. TaxID=2066019 RepID=UPI002F939F5E
MSSHHFVKEGQEPALFITHALSLELVQPLLEWAPLVVVLDSAVDEVLQWGIKIDVVMGATDRIPALKEKLADQHPVTIEAYLKDENPIEKGILFLADSGNTAVTIVIQNPESRFQLAKDHRELQIIFLDNTLKWSMHVERFEKWVAAHTPVLIQVDKSDQTLSYIGLTPDGNRFIASHDGLVRVTSNSIFWIGELP